MRARRGPGRRLILTLAALGALIVGYYLGQYWQRQPLGELSAIMYPNGQAIEYPVELTALQAQAGKQNWRLFVSADTRAAACVDLLRHYATVINRLAAQPDIQQRLRLTLLAYDQPEKAAIDSFTRGLSWVDVLGAPAPVLDRLSTQLGIQRSSPDACTPTQANAVLVAPDAVAWALIPHGQAAIMARDIRTIIAFVE